MIDVTINQAELMRKDENAEKALERYKEALGLFGELEKGHVNEEQFVEMVKRALEMMRNSRLLTQIV